MTSIHKFFLLFAAIQVLSNTGLGSDEEFVNLLLEQIKVSESLYGDLDVTLTFHHESGPGLLVSKSEDSNFTPVINKQATIWSVSQQGMYRVESNVNRVLGDGSSRKGDRVKMYDGDTTRVLREDRIVNITQGYASDKRFVRPHMLLVRRPFFFMPLSILLSGTDVLRTSRKSEWPSYQSVKYDYRGERIVDELIYHDIWITLERNGTQQVRIELSLAKERNLIPAEMVWYQLQISKDQPTETAKVIDWIEVESGIWFPGKTELVSYNPILMKMLKERKVQWTESYEISEVSVTPRYPIEFFQKIDIPNGTAVYEVNEDRNITKSYRKGALSDTGSQNRSLLTSPLIILNLVIICLLCAWLVLKKKFKRHQKP